MLDLFAGPGGWDEGIKDLGLDVLGFEIDPDATATARAAGHPRVLGDLSLIDPNEYAGAEGLIASPPCQGWSRAGKGGGHKDSADLLEHICRARTGADVDASIAQLRSSMNDPRSILVLQPLRWALHLRPRWIAFEQVPSVLPLWQACAQTLREVGYQAVTACVQAEQYGVPQTRRRAVLLARLDGPVDIPAPTHSRYYSRSPKKLDEGVLPWVSMAQALTWGMTHRPYPTLAAGTAAGGADPQVLGGSGARRTVSGEIEQGRWIPKRLVSPQSVAGVGRATRQIEEPSVTVTGNFNRARWEHGELRLRGNQKGSSAKVDEYCFTWTRPDDQGAEEAQRSAWTPDFNDQSGTPYDPEWPRKRPATAVAGRGLVPNPGANANRFNGSTKSRNDGVRVSVEEAGILQSFRADYPWQGKRTSQYQQVGNAVPPLLARAIISALLSAPEPAGPERGRPHTSKA